MRRWLEWGIAMVACAILGAAAAAQDGEAPVSRVQMVWRLDLDPGGAITRLDLQGNWPADLRERVEQDVRRWHFDLPGAANGRAVETYLYVNLRVSRADGDAWRARVDSAMTGARVLQARTVYPALAMRAAREGLVIVDVDFDADGKVIDARLADISPVQSGSLPAVARSAVKRFTLDPERVASAGVSGKATLPICFAATRSGNPCIWRREGSDEDLDEAAALGFGSVVRITTVVGGREI